LQCVHVIQAKQVLKHSSTKQTHHSLVTPFAANASATGAQAGTDPSDRSASSTGGAYNVHSGMTTAEAEKLGSAGSPAFAEMAFSIEKVAVTAKFLVR
jgi:hypothetical protein